ncbi:DUF2243 domain-containing protein [Streptosporangium lutulentum]|uniref:DUF2243 domain-containing protein n=1 Tax=Streptosporangium lutulentum TaxID=1461250 RepID=UPI003520F0CE
MFDLVEGVIDHQVLGVHHVRHGPGRLLYDLRFPALGVVLIAFGFVLARIPSARRGTQAENKGGRP